MKINFLRLNLFAPSPEGELGASKRVRLFQTLRTRGLEKRMSEASKPPVPLQEREPARAYSIEGGQFF